MTQMASSALQAEGAYTKMGTWAPTEADAELIELMADKDEEWGGQPQGEGRVAQPPCAAARPPAIRSCITLCTRSLV